MPLSFSQVAALTCPQCNAPFDADIWLTVDAGERHDLAARCHDGSIHTVTCPNGHGGMIGAPLLYHDRAKQQLFLAFPQGMSQPQVQQVGNQLIQQLRGQLLILPGSSYLDAPQAIPIELLPAAIDDQLDAVMAQMQAQYEKLRHNPAVRVLQEHQTLLDTIQQWMSFDAWNDSMQFAQAHPELVTADADLVLAAMLDLARAQDDADAQEDLEIHLEIVRVARQNGIDAAFEKYVGRGAGNGSESNARAELQARLAELDIHSQDDLDRALPDHPELHELFARVMRDENPILQAIEKLIEARSPEEALQLARIYPMLLEEDGLNALREIISNARSRGEAGMAEHLQQRLTTLEQYKPLR